MDNDEQVLMEGFDFANAAPGHLVSAFTKKVTIRLGVDVIDYFKAEAARTGLPYQGIINMYLRQCVEKEMHLTFSGDETRIE